jgi:hypothetical protein
VKSKSENPHDSSGFPMRIERFLSAISIPPQYGKFNAVHRRYKRWCDKHIWDYILAELIDEPDFEWLMIDASHCKVHPHAAGAIGGNQDMERTKGGSIPKFTLRLMQMVTPCESLSQKVQHQIANRLSIL